jgi:hypothetical protein
LTDQLASAAAATAATPISASPPISRTRLRSAAAMSSGSKAPMSKPRDIVEIATRPRS